MGVTLPRPSLPPLTSVCLVFERFSANASHWYQGRLPRNLHRWFAFVQTKLAAEETKKLQQKQAKELELIKNFP